jgi:hypothetical protein
MARSLRRSEIVVEHGRDHDQRAGRDCYLAHHRPRFEDGDDDRPSVIVCLIREAPACHTQANASRGVTFCRHSCRVSISVSDVR